MQASPIQSISSRMVFSLLLQLASSLRFRRAQQSHPEQGLTLIECLVAIIVVSLTVLAITPPIMLATATRVQSRRAEQANHIAQAEIDRIRLMVERGSYTTADLPALATGADSNIGAAAAASTVASSVLFSPSTCNTYPGTTAAAANSVIPVDVDGDCTPEYLMQVFRNTGKIPNGDPSATPPYAFDVGVRVYVYYPGQTLPTLQTTRASLIAGTGARDAQGGNARRPMAVLYSRMSRNDQSKSLGAICLQGGGTNCPN
ncbi:prepilin-type N-terminal cleavage/methylation domain-containing protein [Kovacikia minuta CCNUW1]|uniref:prepilin-type N-terminal cleavage/methylation domain-containing protein n=1 Tax=Kovacikia minuta TaxID=2931930 RepID=UPI001CCE81F6|nr:prepilin-type N-terminal cleavage/methylation domain-containing protein [Kovacikia minuta]UBF24498.1 prepilin-type N-terminal cleavage/methylation domain-containing protein [Kovacikia minuta CCNUW1]